MNILTFDIEEWYVYELYPKGGKAYYIPIINGCLTRLLDFLDERNTRATFFCLGIMAISHPQIVKQIAERGHEIGCHSNKHILLNQMSPEQFREDTFQAIDSLQNLLGEKIEMYRAPAFSIEATTRWALEILVENGVKYDCSVFPGKLQPRGVALQERNFPSLINTPSGIIYEFPLSYSTVWSKQLVFQAVVIFRFFPYALIRSLTQKSEYNMTYFHVRDFDSQQKRVCSFRYFQSYYGINGAYEKFCRYVNDLTLSPWGLLQR
jgi:peptidoglycan-N-acetylglucosamine deacetylase